jgi:hypothetical protein
MGYERRHRDGISPREEQVEELARAHQLRLEQSRFDPIAEGAGRGLSREMALALWERVAADASLFDPWQAQQRFLDLAARAATQRGQVYPAPGKISRAAVEGDGDAIGARSPYHLRTGSPGRNPPVVHEARRPSDEEASSRLGLDDYRVLGLKDVLHLLGPAHPMRPEIVDAAAAVNRSVAGRSTLWREPLPHTGGATPAGQALWQVAERRAATLYRRAVSGGEVAADDPSITSALQQRGAGQELLPALRSELERELGVSLAGARVHTDGIADRAARALGAEAFTVGEDIFFAGGAYAPETSAGRKLLAHELTHVAQALRGASGPAGGGLRVSRPDEPLEQEAEAVADRLADRAATDDVVDGHAPSPSPSPSPVMGDDGGAADTVHAVAQRGTEGSGTPLPHLEQIQRAFGKYDVSRVRAFVGGAAREASEAIGAEAYAFGDRVAFRDTPDLHTAAHEAAHVVQQRGALQIADGVGVAGDTYERHADAVAERVVAGRSVVNLLAGNVGRAAGAGSPVRAVQRKEGKDDARILANQASLKNTDVEIPALEGALLQTRLEAVNRRLLSQEAFAAGLLLSQAMTKLQPAVAAQQPADTRAQEQAAVAAQQLFTALQKETADEKNWRYVQMPGAEGAPMVTTENPYTGEMRTRTYFLIWETSDSTVGWVRRLPELIRQGKWGDAFKAYRRLSDGLDQWIADQLRKSGSKAEGDAHQYHAQLRTGLDAIADKHATRLPALFHPDPKTIEEEKAAGRPAADTVPMNVYFWKDAQSGTFHLYDLTTPGRPHEQPIAGPPTAAAMNTFFEEVARYPKGEVRYTLPGGGSGVAPTTGKIKWYEWVGYAGLAVAAVGLAVLSAGASVPATVCFAVGAVAGGISAAGHLSESVSLGTATTTTVVLDAAQIVASFASFGALSITVKAGSAAAAINASRWFVPLTVTAAGADVVQMVALTDQTFTELDKIQKGAGSPEDKQRAMAVLVTQLIVMGGLTALSVKGARDVRSLKGKPLEVVEQNGKPVLRVIGETTQPSSGSAKWAEDMRWQMDLKNKKLIAQGEVPRYPDLDAAVKQGLSDFEAAKARGFPYGFKDKASFEEFTKQLKEGVAAKPTPAGGIPVPTGKAAIHGSATYRPKADDVDVAILVDQAQFNRLLEQSFPKEIAKVRARGLDPLKMTMSDATSAAERTLANAVETGILKRDKVVPRLSDVRDKLEAVAGIGVDLSIVKSGGQFDRGPYFSLP